MGGAFWDLDGHTGPGDVSEDKPQQPLLLHNYNFLQIATEDMTRKSDNFDVLTDSSTPSSFSF